MSPPPRRLATTARHEALRDLLLAAAETVIALDGVAAVRARALAEAVGCSLGTIYNVFPDLDALILEVNARTLGEIDTRLRAAGIGASPSEHMVRLALIYLDYASQHRNRWRALFEHPLPAADALPDWYVERRRAVFAHIEAPLALLQPSLEPSPRERLARTLFAAVHGMVQLGLDSSNHAQQIEIVVKAIARGLVTHEPTR